MDWIKRVLFILLRQIVKPYMGTGLGGNPFIATIYRFVAKLIMPSGKKMVDVNGYRMIARFGGIGQGLIFKGEYEPQTTEVFKALIKPKMTVVDIGANNGYFTLLSSRLVGSGGTVWAFEPEPRNFADLRNNLEMNRTKNVIPVNAAVSNSFGKATMFTSDTELGECSLIPCRPFNKQTIMVPTVILDNFVRGKVDFIKSDTEGNEIAILRSAKRILSDNNGLKIVLELYPTGLKAAGYSALDLWGILHDFGFYYITMINERKRKIEHLNLSEIEQYAKKQGSVNILCAKSPITGII